MSEASERVDVVAVGAHPDDLEIVCGGTLARLVEQGYQVALVDLTSGEPTPRGSEETRTLEAEAARVVLGVQRRCNLRLPNRVLMDVPENRFPLATLFRQLRPTIVLGVAGRTPAASPDHHQAHLLIEAARFYSQLTRWDDKFAGTAPYRVPHLVYGLFPSDAEQRQWHGSFVVDVTKTFDKKLASIRCYQSQFDDARFEKLRHFISGNAAAVGGRCGFQYGELFALPAPVGTADFMTLVTGSHGSATAVNLPPRI